MMYIPIKAVRNTLNHKDKQGWFDRLALKLGIQTQNDWYSVPSKAVQELGPPFSISRWLAVVYPQYVWYPWLFHTSPKGLWTNPSIKTAFFDWVASELGIETQEQWYSVTFGKLAKYKLKNLRMIRGEVLYESLESVYPQYVWYPWLFPSTPDGYFENIVNQKKYMDWLGECLGVEKKEDWYLVTATDVAAYKGKNLLQLYHNSCVYNALCAIYPEEQWIAWKFTQVPGGYWNDMNNVKSYIKWLEKELNIQQVHEWTKVTKEMIAQHYGTGLVTKYHGLYNLLSHVYPEHNWKSNSRPGIKLSGRKYQYLLTKSVQRVFPQVSDIYTEFKHPQLNELELDIYIPSLRLAFEYNGRQHYEFHPVFGNQQRVIDNDIKKRTLCEKIGITLVEVPYWWDGKDDSIIATVHLKRPDIFPMQGSGNPIPPQRPLKTNSNKKGRRSRYKKLLPP